MCITCPLPRILNVCIRLTNIHIYNTRRFLLFFFFFVICVSCLLYYTVISAPPHHYCYYRTNNYKKHEYTAFWCFVLPSFCLNTCAQQPYSVERKQRQTENPGWVKNVKNKKEPKKRVTRYAYATTFLLLSSAKCFPSLWNVYIFWNSFFQNISVSLKMLYIYHFKYMCIENDS